MRAPLSWIKEYAALPEGVTGRDLAEKLIGIGLEVETVDEISISGPLLVGRVLEIEELTEFKKPIRYCQVDLGGTVNGIICGATNFVVGDLVPVALPGAVLPGGFEISARKTYGHISDGMICSGRELGINDEYDGILVLTEGEVGQDAGPVLGLDDAVLDIAVTPDRGYCLSIRGIAREAALAYDVAFTDPASLVPEMPSDGPVREVDLQYGADRFTTRVLTDVDPDAPSPAYMVRRLNQCGMRPVSLAVDITNYVMLELGQPLHAFDGTKLTGPIQVRRPRDGEELETLDHVDRVLDAADVVIADDSGAVALAGVMGGLTTEIDEASRSVVLEAAHFQPALVAATSRRHKLSSEASRRFERGIDSDVALAASNRAAQLFAALASATVGGLVDVDRREPIMSIEMAMDMPSRIVGVDIPEETVRAILANIGCSVEGETVTPPTWRPDLIAAIDLVEEVARVVGYEKIPSRGPAMGTGLGLSDSDRLRRQLRRRPAELGLIEVLSYPFVGEGELDQLGLPADDPRRVAVRLANPLSDEQPLMRTSLLPGLLAGARRNVGRGAESVHIYEYGQVFRDVETVDAPVAPAGSRPADDVLDEMLSGLPRQPEHLGFVLCGDWSQAGWWGVGRPVDWSDAVRLAALVARAAGVEVEVAQDAHSPWHPGRCARLSVAGQVIGHAGELHPDVVAAFGLPVRSCAGEMDLSILLDAASPVASAPRVSTFPVAKEDVALVVDEGLAADAVREALRSGGGSLLESVRLFDVYSGPQVPEGKKSLAFSLRMRADDRTLTDEDIAAVRESALAAAGELGATLRG
ncbi:MAG: phenylalanine--tRNA ligase subunit beta [Actinobacteria bacterium]|nr:phenylalanine--tRNA ligase subunit beta [Actinomycetota bacterium]MCB8996303.1 phenylalanine--tRNA ligase subunit beta [Actinomycetota bacterium]MCB9425173.1 phenylalanine--tRNA ligase subunit beta [Actinomycetota bacterium]HRY09307.1 phenylalanine--tRNA ligase subunit beta [Candidatus Nanopelagicales bacterium]